MRNPLRTSWFVLLVLLVLLVLTLTGCMGPTFVVQQYTGAVRPPSTIAVLRINGRDSVRLLTLDDQDMGVPVIEDGRLHIELLPGRHAVTVAESPDAPPTPLAFQAEAGKVYRITFSPAARVFEVDRGSDAIGPDVTIDASRQHVAAPVSPPVAQPVPRDSPADASAGPPTL